jgi:hypothetical protein
LRKIGEMLEGDRMSTSEDRGKAGHREKEIEKEEGCENRRRLTKNKDDSDGRASQAKRGNTKNMHTCQGRHPAKKRWGICREPHKKEGERKPEDRGKKDCSRQANTHNPGI